MTTKKDILNRFPNSNIWGGYNNGEIRLNEKDVNEWFRNPICLKTNCLSEDLVHVGDNETYSTDVYECGSCEAVTLLSYETKHTSGCIGCKGDMEEAY